MTIEEKAICDMYTGICFLAGDDTWARYAYAERLIGRPVYTHEFANRRFYDRLKALAYPDFLKMCKGEPLNFTLREGNKE